MEPKPSWYLMQTIKMRTILTKIYRLYMRNNNSCVQDGIKCNNELIIVLEVLLTKKEVSQQDIIKETLLSKQKVSKIVRELQSKKFVDYKPEGQKTKNLKLYLTTTGRNFMITMLQKILNFDQSALRKIFFHNKKIPQLIQDLNNYANELTTEYNKKNKKAHA